MADPPSALGQDPRARAPLLAGPHAHQSAEAGTNSTWPRLRDILQRMHVGEMAGSEGRFVQRTETAPEQKAIFKVLKAAEPPLVLEAEAKQRT